MTVGIYCIENLINHKKYIGASTNIEKRFSHHKSSLNNLKGDNKKLQLDWIYFTKDNFNFYIIEECEPEFLDELEKHYIREYNTNNDDFGYNMCDGGRGISGYLFSENSKEKRSQKTLGNKNPMYGKKHSDETRATLSRQRVGNNNGLGNKNSLGKFRKRKKYFGVYPRKYIKKNGETTTVYRAMFNYSGITYHLGTFSTEIEAAKAWDTKCYSILKDDNLLNFKSIC